MENRKMNLNQFTKIGANYYAGFRPTSLAVVTQIRNWHDRKRALPWSVALALLVPAPNWRPISDCVLLYRKHDRFLLKQVVEARGINVRPV